MKQTEWNEALNHIDSDVVEEYVIRKEKLTRKNKYKSVWLRIGASAACLALVIGVVFAYNNSKIPVWDNAQFSASYIGELFGVKDSYGGATSSYTKVYVPDDKYLYLNEIPDTEYLGIYKGQNLKKDLDENELLQFSNDFFEPLASSLGCDVPEYEIKDRVFREELRIDSKFREYSVFVTQKERYNSVYIYNPDEKRNIILDGETIQADQRLSDEEIIKSIEPVKNKLFDIFGVEFSDIKVFRYYNDYSEYGASRIYICFYNVTSHPLNSLDHNVFSDYIRIEFDNFESYSDDIVSDGVLSVSKIYYRKYRTDVLKEYGKIADAKRISIEEAEKLLYKGYVFGGHICPICMSMQDKVDFEGYDYAGFEYVFGYDYENDCKKEGIPFYTFYKKIGTSENGNLIYAKTYVPAIEVRGYKEYFESQKKKHRNTPVYTPVYSEKS